VANTEFEFATIAARAATAFATLTVTDTVSGATGSVVVQLFYFGVDWGNLRG
jgi:hypothetical protein